MWHHNIMNFSTSARQWSRAMETWHTMTVHVLHYQTLMAAPKQMWQAVPNNSISQQNPSNVMCHVTSKQASGSHTRNPRLFKTMQFWRVTFSPNPPSKRNSQSAASFSGLSESVLLLLKFYYQPSDTWRREVLQTIGTVVQPQRSTYERKTNQHTTVQCKKLLSSPELFKKTDIKKKGQAGFQGIMFIFMSLVLLTSEGARMCGCCQIVPLALWYEKKRWKPKIKFVAKYLSLLKQQGWSSGENARLSLRNPHLQWS